MATQRLNKRATNLVCDECGKVKEFEEQWYRGFCNDCRKARAATRRKATAERLLAKGKTETRELDGRSWTVTVLPAKRRGGWRR